MATNYNANVSYNAGIPYNGAADTPAVTPVTGGGMTSADWPYYLPPVKRDDDEIAVMLAMMLMDED